MIYEWGYEESKMGSNNMSGDTRKDERIHRVGNKRAICGKQLVII